MYRLLLLSWPAAIGRHEGVQALRNRNKHVAKSNRDLPIFPDVTFRTSRVHWNVMKWDTRLWAEVDLDAC